MHVFVYSSHCNIRSPTPFEYMYNVRNSSQGSFRSILSDVMGRLEGSRVSHISDRRVAHVPQRRVQSHFMLPPA